MSSGVAAGAGGGAWVRARGSAWVAARRWIAAVVAATAAIAVAVLLGGCSPASTPSTDTADGLRVAVIADGSSIAAEGVSWPMLLQSAIDGAVSIDAQAGTGYATASPASAADRVAAVSAATNVVILALGADDIASQPPVEVVAASVEQAVAAAPPGAKVVVLSPLIVGEGPALLTDAIATAATDAGAQYVEIAIADTTALAAEAGGLSASGRRFVADRVADLLTDAGR